MKQSHLSILLLIVLCSFIHVSCKKEPPIVPPEEKPTVYQQSIFLSVADSGLTEIYLKLSITDSLLPRGFALFRNNSQIMSGSLFGKETTLVDTAAQINTAYSYRAFRMENSLRKDSSNMVMTKTLDTTSHEFIWKIDTVGLFQSVLFDVWGTDLNNVYAIGSIYLSADATQGTNVMHWDGAKWNPEPFWEGNISAIYGFSKNDIWVGGDWGGYPDVHPLFGHWNGTKWEKTVLPEYGWIRKLWGTSSNNLYAVGGEGGIFHYNGTAWSQMNSNTSVHLWDIWGFSDKQIYAAGFDYATGRGALLYYNGTMWQTIYDKIWSVGDQSNNPAGRTHSVWGYDISHTYVWTPPGTFVGNGITWEKISIPTDNITIWKIRGSSKNNIFMVGDFGAINHWNGKSWNRYDQFYNIPNGDNLYSTIVFKNQVFVVGRSGTAKGIVYRGTININ